MFENIDKLKKILDQHRPLPAEIVKNLREDLLLRWTYHTNAIEGNTLSLQETKVVLEGITVGGKTVHEHLEALNHREAICYVESLVQKGQALTESQICSIHQLVLKGIDPKNAGVYRKTNVLITGASHRPPQAVTLNNEMMDFIKWYNSDAQGLHPVERAARVHVELVGIHPFTDGNGRTSRLFMNFELMKAGLPPAVLSVEKRLEYYGLLDEALVAKNYSSFIQFVATSVAESFEPYWYALGLSDDQEETRGPRR